MVRPGYKRTEVGEIPEDWEVVPLLTLARVGNGQVDPKVDPYRSMILVAPDHIESNTGRLLSTATAAEQRAISGKYLFARGDVVYSKIRPYLRKAILAPFAGLCSADMYPLKPAPGVSAGLLLAILLSNHFTAYAVSVSVRSGMPKINRVELAGYSAAVPPIPAEQAAIADAVDAADTLIQSLEHLLAKKRAIKQGAMQSLLTGAKRLPGFSGPWRVGVIGDVADVKTGPFGSSLHESDYVLDGTPIVTVEHLGEMGLVHENLPRVSRADQRRLATYSLEPGDIVFSRVGSIDRNALVRPEEAGWLFSGRLLRVRLNKMLVCPSFMSFQFHSTPFKARVREIAVGQTMLCLNTKLMKGVTVDLPPLLEQAAIAEVLADLDADLDATAAKLDKARAIKQGMMQELLTGRIRLV